MSWGLWDRSPHGDDDVALDAVLAETWEDGAAAVAKVLDIESGKGALLATLHKQAEPGRQGSEDGALGAVCEEVDALLAIITAENRINLGPAHTTAMPYLQTARSRLIQLRTGLRRRDLGKAQALDLADNVRHALTQASRTLQALPPGSLPASDEECPDLMQIISGLLQRLKALAGQIERLFDGTGNTARVPVPR